MLSKQQFANAIIHKYSKTETPSQEDIVGNVELAVAMEHLDLIEKDEDKAYADRLDFTVFEFQNPNTKENEYISARDLFKLLPDEVRVCKTCNEQFWLYKRDLEYFKTNGYELPVRCRACRDKRKQSREQNMN